LALPDRSPSVFVDLPPQVSWIAWCGGWTCWSSVRYVLRDCDLWNCWRGYLVGFEGVVSSDHKRMRSLKIYWDSDSVEVPVSKNRLFRRAFETSNFKSLGYSGRLSGPDQFGSVLE
jgi:hypothetical protein